MNEKFVFGMVLGLCAGALIVANSVRLRKTIVEKQAEVKAEVSKMAEKAAKNKNKAKGE